MASPLSLPVTHLERLSETGAGRTEKTLQNYGVNIKDARERGG